MAPNDNHKRQISELWSEDCEEAMAELKRLLTSAPILGHPDFEKNFILEVDASFLGLGAVLSQQQDGKNVVISYASRSLRTHERNMNNYSSRKLELLALKWAMTEKFRDLLIGSKIIAYTDNNPVSHLQTSKLGATELQWVTDLALFDYTIKYRSGKSNVNADSLSRKDEHGTEPKTVRFEQIHSIQQSRESTAIPNTLKDRIRQMTADVWLAEIQTRSSKTVPPAISTLTSITTGDMIKLQKSDESIGRFLMHWNNKAKPSRK